MAENAETIDRYAAWELYARPNITLDQFRHEDLETLLESFADINRQRVESVGYEFKLDKKDSLGAGMKLLLYGETGTKGLISRILSSPENVHSEVEITNRLLEMCRSIIARKEKES